MSVVDFVQIELAALRTDGGTQSRVLTDEATIQEYAAAMRDGDRFPPVTAFYDGKDYWLADGFHRVKAAEVAGLFAIEAEILDGDRRDAVLYSVGANGKHGLRRTNADKRRAVMLLLEDDEWRQWSDREIARQCGVGNRLVSSLRNELSVSRTQIERNVTRNGTTYTMDTGNIGRTRPALPDDAPSYLEAMVDSGDIGVKQAAAVASAFSEAPEAVQWQMAKWGVVDDAMIPRLTHAYDKGLETWRTIVATGTLDGERPIARVSPTEFDEYLERAAYEHRAAGAASSGIQPMQFSKNNEWYTPAQYIDAARAVMGSIDTDPASNDIANKTVRATTYYTAETNGLDKDWYGNVWLNPPYGGIAAEFVARLLEQHEAGNVKQAVVLVNANTTDTKWFQPLFNHTLCFTNHRIDFNSSGAKLNSSTHGSCFIYIGPNVAGFARTFSQFGNVVRRVDIAP